LSEVLTKVKKGEISSMATKHGSKGDVTVGTSAAMGGDVPVALQAVTLQAMATDRKKRYARVEAFAVEIESCQNGFTATAEDAGAWKRVKLWVGRNKVRAGSVAGKLAWDAETDQKRRSRLGPILIPRASRMLAGRGKVYSGLIHY